MGLQPGSVRNSSLRNHHVQLWTKIQIITLKPFLYCTITPLDVHLSLICLSGVHYIQEWWMNELAEEVQLAFPEWSWLPSKHTFINETRIWHAIYYTWIVLSNHLLPEFDFDPHPWFICPANRDSSSTPSSWFFSSRHKINILLWISSAHFLFCGSKIYKFISFT